MFRFCHLPAGTEHMTFENFRPGGNPSLREALTFAQEIIPGGTTKWLTMAGTVDLGKTHLAIAICRRWLEVGEPSRFANVPVLLNDLRDSFQLEGEDSFKAQLDRLLKVPLLVLDDMGAEKSTEWGREQLQTIVYIRGINAMPLIVTTNRPLNEIVGGESADSILASQRIGSRLQRETWCKVIWVKGAEHRVNRSKA